MSGSLSLPMTSGPTYSGTKRKTTTRVLKVDFGDGYGQRVTDGLNTVRDEWTVAWDSLTESEAQTVDSFLRGRGGTLPFSWQAPGDTLPKRWLCNEWEVTPIDPGAYAFNATFTQVFDL